MQPGDGTNSLEEEKEAIWSSFLRMLSIVTGWEIRARTLGTLLVSGEEKKNLRSRPGR